MICKKNLTLTKQQQTILFSDEKLTAFLNRITNGRARFCLLSADWSIPSDDESRDLNALSKEKMWIRKAEWRWCDVQWVKAKMFIPSSTVEYEPALLALGDKPLGAVYADRLDLIKNKIEVDWVDDYIQRRTFFSFGQYAFLVSEIFLPAFWDFVSNV